MPRIAGIDIPEKKKIRFALRYIHGIGPKASDVVLAEAEVDGETRAKDLTDQEVSQIATVIDAGHIVEGSLRRQVQQHIQRLKDIREAMPDVVPYTPAGRGKVFFEDDSELLRVCLKALHSRPRYVVASPRSKVLLPGEHKEKALQLCRAHMQKQRKPSKRKGSRGR